ncbi:MAG TPA: YhjD/YihY/BrkB family envelope integrity protein [Solirubrobacterales bacterium]|nr:YhjD/YihY/BrkB family envelope integrity protein [Solirubrobacterales bacterium]
MDTQRPLRILDRFQQRHPPLAVPVATAKKFGDDEGGDLAALIAYRAFFSLFPLLLLLTTVLGYVLAGDPGLRREAVDSVLTQFPVVGEQIEVGSLQGSGVALAIGIVGSLWAGFGVVLATERVLDRVWGVPSRDRLGFVASRLRALGLLALLGVLTIVSTVASGLVGGGSGLLGPLGGVAISVVLNLLVFGALFSLLGAKSASFGTLLPGIAAAAFGWSVLQLVGGYFVSHQVQNASPAYGTFALVLGLLVWVQLGATLTVLSAELNTVLARRLWPRSLLGHEREAFEPTEATRIRRGRG